MTDTLLERGREAASRGEWPEAHDLLMKADADGELSAADLALLANVAYSAGHLDVTIEAWERAHSANLRAGDLVAAAGAAIRVALHMLFDTALMAPVRGWLRRAERLLQNQDETPVHAWLAVVRSYERLLSGDFQAARRWARQAIEVGTRRDPAAAAVGRIAEARSLILAGEVREGLDLLDEAAVAAVSGELDPMLTGLVYCELVCALQAVAQYDLAEEWTQAMERWRHGQPIGSLHGRCRVHRAEILRLRGFSSDAEKEALLACDELRPYVRRELGWPLTELGRIRLRVGDLDGAEEAFMEAMHAGWDPQPGLAMVQLARGHVALAAASIRDALERPLKVPSKELPPNTELRRAPLLEAQVEIAIAAGDLERARWAADELRRVAATFESKPLVAAAALASGRVLLAEGDSARARHDFETSAELCNQINAPFETALARLGLARAYRADGNEERAALEFSAARSGFERVGAMLHAQSAHSSGAVARDRTIEAALADETRVSAESLESDDDVAWHLNEFRREGEYWSVTFAGRTDRLRDAKGLRYLARILADPGREFHVLDLVAGERGWTPEPETESGVMSARGDAGEMLDARAKESYRRRLAEIEEDIEDSRAAGDTERETQAEAEREFLIRELSRAVGFGGRDRRAGVASERARASVTRAVRFAMDRIREHNPALGEHLDRSIRTGTQCVYLPGSRGPVAWHF